MHPEVTNYIENSAASHQPILNELRQLIFSIAPNVVEQFKWSRPVYALEKDFCYIKTTKKHVSFGFFDFGKIKTNQQAIEGTGQSMRHVKLNSVADIKTLQVNQMIQEVLQ